ncbi:MAG: amidohydrolase family protein, partial [Rubrivivax sp.]|nr:amidohydrolase family protein [Rubrivivax sp.]
MSQAAKPQGWDAHVHVFDADAPVAAGHYRPAHRPLAAIEAEAARHGVHHLVLVQPSVYGTDNSLLLKALASSPGRHRGVVVVGNELHVDEAAALHAAGVRGVRFNLVSPVGEHDDPAARLRALAPTLRGLGWHVQWYVRREQLSGVRALHEATGLVAVLDHLAGLAADTPSAHAAWTELQALADLGAWVKLSGWYRLGASEPYAALGPHIRRVAAMFGERCVWGSDWPHKAFAPQALPSYASTWRPVVQA